MENFTFIDGIVAVLIVVSALLAFSRGFVRELMAILGWVAAIVLGYLLAPTVVPLLKEIPSVGSFFAGSCELSTIVAFVVVVAISLVVLAIFTPLMTILVEKMSLGRLDQAFGLIFGVVRGIILVVITLIIYERIVPDQGVAAIDNSRTASMFSSLQSDVNDQIPDEAPGWLIVKYESMISTCVNN